MILLRNILCGDNRADILTEGKLIKKIAAPLSLTGADALSPECKIIDGSNKAVIPGFINMHTHAAMSLMRGMQEDVVFKDWIKNIWRIEKKVDEEFVYHGTRAAALEMIKTGTTTFNDQYWYGRAARKAACELGIRPVISYVILDDGDKGDAERQKEECIRMYEESMNWEAPAMFEVAFHAIYSVSEEMIMWTSDFAKKHNLLLHIHLSETEKEVIECKAKHKGLSPVEYLNEAGVLDNRVLAAHTLWLSDRDIEILGKNKVNCIHNINSNTKLTSGFKFKYEELKEAGANVCIGTDGCASSNNLDMLEAMKTSALFQKAWRGNPGTMPLNELMDMATINGAKALNINSGKIEEGADADLCIVDTDNVFFLSPGSFTANLIYSAHSDCIETVIAGGKIVMENRVIKGEREILDEAKKIIKKLT